MASLKTRGFYFALKVYPDIGAIHETDAVHRFWLEPVADEGGDLVLVEEIVPCDGSESSLIVHWEFLGVA